ncbi:hypothetical protein [Nocardiopsis sp. YSL2]|uniref:hypothetical protein n=1 Tax=Nocardiopsis sp. YSL2 TaxID=2939492 RepID=UPI0026F419EA|nr:hypothetical protein [Nocardiopsis sp. YSL2]
MVFGLGLGLRLPADFKVPSDHCRAGRVRHKKVMEYPTASALQHLLVEALAVVAADASDQAGWTGRHVVGVDEIALNFDDAFRMFERPIEQRQIDESSVCALREIDALFTSMSGTGNSIRWTESALSSDKGWIQVRRVARQVLIQLTGRWDHPLPDIQVIRCPGDPAPGAGQGCSV